MKIDRLYDNRAVKLRYIWYIFFFGNVWYMIFDPVWADAKQMALSITYIILMSASLFFMSLSYIKADLNYIKPAVMFIILNNLLGIMDLVLERDTTVEID